MPRLALVFALLSTPALAQVSTLAGTDGKNALGTVPCATNAGEPLRSCNAELRRHDDGQITLAVGMGNGEVRNIYFTDGVPDSTNSAARLSYETQGNVMVIFVDPGEVYEIPTVALTAQ
ncbi:hypothetical protein [Ruegeria lacuscaerulensis]|uniref:hypothetical protein n=1 Tax=Ruegeria lacuscaerulensis TaxID=55218 RepID=UPI00148129DC|nr:hypothetical protein [Ruegeria lacuscaerulensis]